MHRIGDKIIYGAFGVMTIVDIREESALDVSRSYYVLKPTLLSTESLTFVPADNERLVSFMRPLMTRDEVIELLHYSKDPEPMEWIVENRARQESFKRLLESGDRKRIVSMICAINESGKRREAEGKKNFVTDENIKAKAEKLLRSEIAVVFDIPEDGVKILIENIIG